MFTYDDGHVLKIKRMGGGFPIPNIMAGKSYHLIDGEEKLVDSYIEYDGGYQTTGGRSFAMRKNEVMEFVYYKWLSNEVDGAIRYGCWVQTSRTTY